MFVFGAGAAVASGKGSEMPYATKDLVDRGWAVICELCEASGTELSSSFGNFDKLVGLGWLIGDVVLGRLIDQSDAHAVGRKAAKLAPKLKGEFAAPARSAGKRKSRSDEEQRQDFKDAAEEEVLIRAAKVDLPLPASPSPNKRQKADACAAPATSTAAPASPVAVPAPPTLKELGVACDVAAAALLVADGDVSRGAQAVKRARDAKIRAYNRMTTERAYNIPDDQLDDLVAHHWKCNERVAEASWVHLDAEEIQSNAALALEWAQMDLRYEEERQQREVASDAARALDDERHAKCMAGIKLPQDDYERLMIGLYGCEEGRYMAGYGPIRSHVHKSHIP